MKKLVLPLLIGVLGGVASASAATIMNAKKTSAAFAVHVADSVAKHAHDSTAAADSIEKELKAHATEAAAEETALTPADSIREAQNLPTTLKSETKGLANAADPKHSAPAAAAHGAAPATHAPAPVAATGHDAPAANAAKALATPAVKPASLRAPSATRVSSDAPESAGNGLPDNRIAKIFSAMQPKEAAKVLEQMSDNDIRVILGKMSDKQAAAILVAIPATRAAAISRGESAKPDALKPDAHKPEATKPDTHKVEAAKADSGKIKKDAGGEHK